MAQELSRLAARLEEARSGVAGLARSRERVQARMTVLEQEAAKLGRQATVARQFGREDLADKALTRQQEVQSQRAELAVQLGQLLDEEAKLTIVAQRLQARKARIYWSGLQAKDGGDPFGATGRS
jgi:phage shock protein A